MLNEETKQALDAFQNECNHRMADWNAGHEPPGPLFHYTNEESLRSIVASEVFWFPSIYHMDDTEELNFGFNVSQTLIRESEAAKTGLSKSFCSGLLDKDDLERIRSLVEFYSVSFGLRDIPQQWERYGDLGRGVALGVAPDFFRPVPFKDPENPLPEEQIFYGKVFYGDKAARERHAKVLEAAFDLIEEAQVAGWIKTVEDARLLCANLASSMYTEILWNCVTTKDHQWSEQSEMRLLARNFLKNPHLPIVNRETRPRVEITQPRLKSSIVEVMVGPNAPAGAVTRMRKFLIEHGLGKVAVTRAASK